MVKRLNYFDGQFLRARDFNDEQAYHVGMRRKHNSLLHTWGIADGLMPSKAETARIKVSKGFAIDSAGNEIQLDDDLLSEDLSKDPALRGTAAFITIQWVEIDADASDESGTSNVTRKELKPKIKVSIDQPKDGTELILGTVKLGSDGGVESVDTITPLRRIAGAKGGSNFNAVGLTLTGLNIKPEMQPSFSANTPGQVDLKGSLKIDGGLTVTGGRSILNTKAEFGAKPRNYGPMVYTDNLFGMELGFNGAKWTTRILTRDSEAIELGKYPAGGRDNVDQFKPWMTLIDNGNVGIGTSSPVSTLHTYGNNGTITINNTGELFDDGNFHIHSKKGTLWLNALDGDVRINNQTNGGVILTNGTGKVGIGTTAPAEQLDVAGSVRAMGSVNWQNGFYASTVAVGQTPGNVATLRIAPKGAYAADTEAGFTGTDTSIPFVIRTGGNAMATFLTNGNIAIGATSANHKLDIWNGGIGFSGKDLNSSDKKLYSPTDGDLEWWTQNAASGHGFAVSNNGVKAVYLSTAGNSYLNGGNVGIGTTTPADQLHVYRGDDTNWSGRGVFSGKTNAAVIGTFQGKAVVGGHNAALNAWSTLYVNNEGSAAGGTTIMGIGGNVGIGVTTPPEKLSVGGNIAVLYDFALKCNHASKNWNRNILITGWDLGGDGGDVLALTPPGWSGSTIKFYTASGGGDVPAAAASEKMRIDLNGNVGIGTKAPKFKLDVNGPVRIGGFPEDESEAWTSSGSIIWCRNVDTNGRWDEGLLKHSSTNSRFGRAGFGIHMHESREFGFYSTGWRPLMSIEGGSGNVRIRGSVQGNYGDLAEIYLSDVELVPGELVSLDPDADRIIRSREAEEAVIGIVSTTPAFVLNMQEVSSEVTLPAGVKGYPVALCGRVPCKVTDENGPIRRGDALTASSKPGHAMRAEPMLVDGKPLHRPGTLVGKALENHPAGDGVIEVFVALR
jgi:hypothetical protein